MKKFAKASEIQVGVVGYGGAFNMGRAHFNEMQAAGMTPLAVAEVDPERLAVAAKEFPGIETYRTCLLYTSPSPRDRQKSRMPSSA